jgi:hypothetical protein
MQGETCIWSGAIHLERGEDVVSVQNERIEVAFQDEYNRLVHEGIEKLLEMSLAEVLFKVYRRGYIRGHSDRSREVQQDEEQARREGRYPMNVSIKHEGDRLVIDGRDVTPRREEPQSDPRDPLRRGPSPSDPPPEYRPNH